MVNLQSQSARQTAVSEIQNCDPLQPLQTEPAQNNREAAMWWSDFGFLVVPMENGSLSPTAGTVPTDCDRNYVDRLWQKHPTHEVGFTVGEITLVVSVNSLQGQAALDQIEKTLGRFPNLIVRTPTGFEHFFWLDRMARLGRALECPHNGHIGMKTGKDVVLLPPHGGKVIVKNDACSFGDFTVASQAFVDAVQLYNSTALPVAVDTSGVPDAAGMVPVFASAVALAGAGESGETGESGAWTHLPVPSGVGPNEGGETGESGGSEIAPASDTGFAGFTTFSSQPAQETSRVAPTCATPTGTPIETGESGGSLDVGVTLALDAFHKLQAASLAALPALADAGPHMRPASHDADDIFTPKADENQVVTTFKAKGLYQTPLGSGSHKVICPWAHQHTDGVTFNTTYSEPDDLNVAGRFQCEYRHPGPQGVDAVLEFLGIPKMAARNKPVIRVSDGDLHRVVDAQEKVLAARGRHYQSGGMIVSIKTDPLTGDPSVVPTNVQTLTRELSAAADFERFVGGKRGFVPCDPPPRQVGILLNSQSYGHLRTLAGLARQPYFGETDGVLVTEPGYDTRSKLFGVFDPRPFVLPAHPTKANALAALNMLLELISEFRFAEDCDRSTAVSAMCTAANRPSLPQAPGFHVKAAMPASGKSILCETFVLFAGTAESKKISFPSTSEEATKTIMSTLLTCPAAVEFDDMTTDWIPHGIINRMLTSSQLTDRLLGVSKNATVGTRALFLSSGNNVGPVRDAMRRVVTINLDPRCASPAMLTYQGNPVETLRKHRAAYVAAVLTINLAWKAAGSPRTNVSSIATYGGAWADYCRHPLIWLGLPDPATSLLAQVSSDSDSDNFGALLTAWYKAFGTVATTVRRAVGVASFGNDDLKEAIHEFPVVERGEINPGKLGYILKRNVNRIVGALKLVDARADGRKAWAIEVVDPAALALSLAAANSASMQRSSGTQTANEIDDSDLY